MPQKADVIVMNPPYVRQESLPQAKKDYYVSEYSLSKKSDLFAYFLVRNLSLLANDGVSSVISSDKWLETSYGISLQKRLEDHLIAIYGQQERTFGADINTVITVYSKKRVDKPMYFTYVESYGGKEVRRHVEIRRNELTPGKWFYLRAPKVFVEKILPKLKCKLKQFAIVKFGIKTGANAFFFLKDVSHSYETDFLADQKTFENWHVDARNEKDLIEKGLIYVENEGGQRFIIDRKDVAPVVRSPTEMNSYVATHTQSLVFRPNPPEKPGRYSKQYISWGETVSVIIGKGTEKGKRVKGFNKLSSTKSHRPFWFNIPNLDPAPLISFKFIGERHFTPLYRGGVLADHTCDMIYPLRGFEEALWIYMNSSLFFLTRELYGIRMGGGALQMQSTAEMGEIPIPDVSSLKINPQIMAALKKEPLPLLAELEQEDRKNMDSEVLNLLGFEKPDILVEEIKIALIDVLTDRLIKANLVDKTQTGDRKRRSRK